MGLKKFKPITPGLRFRQLSSFEEITQKEPEKSLLRKLSRTGGRNNQGNISQRRIGGRHRRHYRVIDFKRDKLNIPARVATIEYDPNRSSRIALLHYVDGEKRYILAPQELTVGMTVVSADHDHEIVVGANDRVRPGEESGGVLGGRSRKLIRRELERALVAIERRRVEDENLIRGGVGVDRPSSDDQRTVMGEGRDGVVGAVTGPRELSLDRTPASTLLRELDVNGSRRDRSPPPPRRDDAASGKDPRAVDGQRGRRAQREASFAPLERAVDRQEGT